MHYVGIRNPRAEHNPVRSVPLFKPAAQVLRTTAPRQLLEAKLAAARRDIGVLTAALPHAYAALGKANRLRAMRRFWQAKAFRQINTTRAQLRAARKALAEAETALLALDGDLFGRAT